MNDKEFNLLSEPWIRVITPEYSLKEVSVTDALLNSQNYLDLRGELPTQDIALLRLLLAILHTVFTRFDSKGAAAPLRDADDAYDRWEELWRLKRFPEKPLLDYLDVWRERFWLFHPERPFGQVAAMDSGTKYTAAKLNGEMSESNHKTRLFSLYSGGEKKKLSYSQAARWLLHVNAFDDKSAKTEKKGVPHLKCGWLGELGLITAAGDNLFETLMLNLPMLDSGGELFGADAPCWELQNVISAERTEIAFPDNIAGLFTLQSRRLLLGRKQGCVDGYTLQGGDFFPKENMLVEPMTVWRPLYDGKEQAGWQPKRHDPARQMWREFPNVFFNQDATRQPGAVQWIARLKSDAKAISKRQLVKFRIASVQYGKDDFFVTDIFQDSLTFHIDLITNLGRKWQLGISDEISRCNDIADLTAGLAKSIAKAAGGRNDSAGQKAKEQFYFRIDAPFRKWLQSVDPNWDEQTGQNSRKAWRKTALQTARELGNELVAAAGASVIVGRTVTEKTKKGKVTNHYSAAEALNRFLYQLNKNA